MVLLLSLCWASSLIVAGISFGERVESNVHFFRENFYATTQHAILSGG